MTVGVAVLDQALPEPHDPLHPEVPPQRRLDLLAAQSDGLRFGFSRHCSVVSSVPAPSVRIEPPSSTIGAVVAPRRRAARRSARRPRRPRSHGGNFSPHALKPKWTAMPPAVVAVDVDRAAVAQPRVVERQLDDLDPPPHAARACAASSAPGLAIIVTGSNAAIALATAGVVGARLLERLAPQLGPARPAHHRPLVRLPIRPGCASASEPTCCSGGRMRPLDGRHARPEPTACGRSPTTEVHPVRHRRRLGAAAARRAWRGSARRARWPSSRP